MSFLSSLLEVEKQERKRRNKEADQTLLTHRKHWKNLILRCFPHLIADLTKALNNNKLERKIEAYLRPDLLVIDEVGYMQLCRQAAEMLFRLIKV